VEKIRKKINLILYLFEKYGKMGLSGIYGMKGKSGTKTWGCEFVNFLHEAR
jgi:hypothetical protein